MTYSGIDLIPRLEKLYKEMDNVYGVASRQAGFSCEGCDGIKCCTVDLIVHTFAEMLYLRRGFSALDEFLRLQVKARCADILKAKAQDPTGSAYRDSVCSLNFDGKCALYQHRPMICRLAGIPHVINRPDSRQIRGVGCSSFEEKIRPMFPEISIDRTNFYTEMARLEMLVRQELGRKTPSLTVAEILSGCP